MGWAVLDGVSLQSNLLYISRMCPPSPNEWKQAEWEEVSNRIIDIHKVPGTVLGSRNLGVYQSLALLSRNSLSREKDRHATNISGSDGMMAWGCHPGSRGSHGSACSRNGELYREGGPCS